MDQGRRRLALRAPSPAMIVALVALVFAMSGTAVAASKLVNGDKLIKKNSLSGDRLRDGKVTARKIKDGAVITTKIKDGALVVSKVGALPGARVRSSVNQSIPTSALTALTFNTADANVGDLFSAAQPTRLTAPVAGTYLVTATVQWSNGAGGSRRLTLRVNGATPIAAVDGPPNGDGTLDQNVATVHHLNAGDYVEAVVWQTSGAARNSWNAPNNAPVFTMNWIAP